MAREVELTSDAAPSLPQPEDMRTKVEVIKEESGYLRGTIALELARPSDHFNDADKGLLKFHGTYQQDDRDARKQRSKEGVGRYYMFMVRCKIPGGKLTAEQYLALDDIAGRHANGTLRITSRQGIQFHGVIKSHLWDTLRGVNDCLLTTLGACGDVERNVMAPPAPLASPRYRELQRLADVLAEQLAPRTRAYHEIWLNGKPVQPDGAHGPPSVGLGPSVGLEVSASPSVGGEDDEPLYGKVYLPRKFKTGLALPEDNSVDIYAQDLGFLANVEAGNIVGYNVLVGGGMGTTHGHGTTFPHLARPICYIQPDQVVAAAQAVIKLFRDHGNRKDRRRARIKYLVHDWGVEKFTQVLTGYLPFPLVPPRPIDVQEFPLHLGWHAQGDGKFYYGVHVETGRIKDDGPLRLRTALRRLVESLRPSLRLTPVQDILLCDLAEHARPEIERMLEDHGVALPERVSAVRQHSMACPAIPTCGLALSESERVLPGIIDQLEGELARLGLAGDKISVRMTGCPNGCARPYQSDIGIVGRSGDKYSIFVGGNLLGTRLGYMLKDLVPLRDIVPLLSQLLETYTSSRLPGEGFGDFWHRQGADQARGEGL